MKKMMKFAAAAVMLIVALFALALWIAPPTACATAATASVNTPQRSGDLVTLLQGSNVVYAGTIVAITNGLAAPATDGASQLVVGRCNRTSDNTGANYSATRTVNVARGVFQWGNAGSLTNTDVGNFCYVADDSNVTSAGSSSAKIIAGVIVAVDANGVWVDTIMPGAQGATSVSSLTDSGNAAITGTLGVTGTSKLTGNTIVVGTLTSTGTVAAVNNATVGG
ncbi:MAG: hypothetical protein NTY53_24595, partial [Kiritimatiellaeota bacterium]|nr:hypothetical protein [Kiritimatiellota bacterium]